MTASVHQRQPPQLLPPDICHFTDRQDELGALDALMAADGSGPAAMVISAIAGTAGMGKTSLAVRWAHRVRDRFPDGQLYVNLRGYDAGPPVTPEQALDGFLRALGVPAEAIPTSVEAMAEYYRSLVSGSRMLMILDSAATPDQARPLLPASPRCVVLVTSRSRMSGLVAREGARRITLDFLPVAEAAALLRTIIRPDRVDREPEAVAALARRCALPDPRAAVADAEIVVLATNSGAPVIDAAWIRQGAHVTTLGPKEVGRHECPVELAVAADVLVTDSLAQLDGYAQPFFLDPTPHRARMRSLASVVADRPDPEASSVFCSVGLAGTEVAVAATLLPG